MEREPLESMYLLFKKWWFPIAMFGGVYNVWIVWSSKLKYLADPLRTPKKLIVDFGIVSFGTHSSSTNQDHTDHRSTWVYSLTAKRVNTSVGKFSEHFVGKFSGKPPGSTTKLRDSLAYDSTWIPTKLQTIAITWRSLLGDIFWGNL